jgi:EAL domain-containing protein (putative c-di-GMP-specific phosphodiesterase class I)/DNA-binding NarL/FixJ family response regulator
MPCKNLRFLVVEDHEFQRKVLVQLLTMLGAQAVYGAEDGIAALRVMRDPDRPVDIVISDLAMPGMDGMEFVRHLSESGARVSLILTSAVDRTLLASVGSMAQAYKVNLLGVVPKPVTAVKLTPLIEQYRASKPLPSSPTGRYPLEEIARAWSQDEFEPWFEPKVELASGQVKGMSAVPRWQHQQEGMLAGEDFLPSIAARGLNDDFVWMMLRKSAAQCREWSDKGNDVTVSVNVAFDSLTDVDLAARVQQIAQKEGLEPRMLILSVTEAALNTELARALENLARLRVMGFGLGIDDFGSGLMATEQLSRVAFTELKIGDAFVTGSDFDETIRAGLAVSLETASQLKVQSVAGGIRSKEEWNLLHEWGCVLGQGPFISPPLAGSAVSRWLRHWRDARLN